MMRQLLKNEDNTLRYTKDTMTKISEKTTSVVKKLCLAVQQESCCLTTNFDVVKLTFVEKEERCFLFYVLRETDSLLREPLVSHSVL